MNNWLALTPEQVNAIKLQVNSFNEEEVQFNGSIKIYDASFDVEKITEVVIEWLEIKVLDQFFTLIDRETELKGAVIELTNQQYDEVREKLLKRTYDH